MVVNPENLAKLASEIAKLAQGWAVADHEGNILVDTVSPTPRAAKVNWLYVHVGEPIDSGATDRKLNNLFALYASKPVYRAKLIEVVIQPAEDT